jgi:hypothetical protein
MSSCNLLNIFFFFSITNYIVFTACHDKNTWSDFLFLLAKGLNCSPPLYMFVYYTFFYLSMYIHNIYINVHIHQSLKPKPHGDAPKILTAKPLQDFNIKEKIWISLCSTWNCLGNSNFNIHFFFQNLFKCYKWKHEFETYQ